MTNQIISGLYFTNYLSNFHILCVHLRVFWDEEFIYDGLEAHRVRDGGEKGGKYPLNGSLVACIERFLATSFLTCNNWLN